MAHAPLLSRTQTAPVGYSQGPQPTSSGRLPGLGQTMSHASRSSQLSGSTAFTSSSTTSLSSIGSSTTLVPNINMLSSGPVMATNSIINQKADASRSLYQICVKLRRRLTQVPGFDAQIMSPDSEDTEEDSDPVSSLWRCLRRGEPLLTIYNAIQPAGPLRLDESVQPEKRRAKMAAFKFVEACLQDLKLPPGEIFTLSDLFGDDTTGFVKVTQVINIVLDVAQSRGTLMESADPASETTEKAPGGKKSQRDYIVAELVETERKYVQDLENLHDLKQNLEQKNFIAGDVVHNIFLNINAILDFQRRFLIKIETTNTQPDEEQEWGLPFANYEESFGIYQPFIANQQKAAALQREEFDKIILAQHPVAQEASALDGFLLKPMQRLVKYPQLLGSLRKDAAKNGAPEHVLTDLDLGIQAAENVLRAANNAVDREMRHDALNDLCARVDDWKNHRVDHFGDLLIHGEFPVVTGKSDVQKLVRRPTPFFAKSRSVNENSTTVAEASDDPSHRLFVFLVGDKPRIITSDGAKTRFLAPPPPEYRYCDHLGPEPVENCSGCQIWEGGMSVRRMLFLQGPFNPNNPPVHVKDSANTLGIECPHYEQYTIYLFERILLCCKEANPNKSKDKVMGIQKDKKDKKDKKNKDGGKGKLQLKGRIFMTNVTEVIQMGKPGDPANKIQPHYTIQIFWKGDPGVENFLIKFANETDMKAWGEGVDNQRREHATNLQSATSPETQSTDFAWMRDQGNNMPNPYAEQDDNDDEDDYIGQQAQPNIYSQMQPTSGFPRNSSNPSLRSRSTTGESSQSSIAGVMNNRGGAPSRFPMGMGNPPLSVQTQLTSQSAMERGADSYFSPVAESPASSRTSGTPYGVSGYFPRQGTPQSGWEPEFNVGNRNTAPAMGRAPSRDSSTPVNNPYSMGTRGAQRPSLPAMAQGSQASLAQQRSRSYSTPDINAQPGNRRTGPPGGPVPAVPGIPPHLHPAYDAGIARSANNSPGVGIPLRTSTQSPGTQKERMLQSQFPTAPVYTRNNTSQVPMNYTDSRSMSPPNSALSADSGEMALPTQLKVKVNVDGNYVTLVVAFNITYQTLIDRIDAKVGRFSSKAIARGTMRLRYRDEDGDFVTIESDDDIQIAFQEWRESQKDNYQNGQLGEIELFCLSVAEN